MYLDFLNRANSFEDVKFVFGFTYKCFRVDGYDLNRVPMEVLGSKPLRIHLEPSKDI